jgi:hypothetical protein
VRVLEKFSGLVEGAQGAGGSSKIHSRKILGHPGKFLRHCPRRD